MFECGREFSGNVRPGALDRNVAGVASCGQRSEEIRQRPVTLPGRRPSRIRNVCVTDSCPECRYGGERLALKHDVAQIGHDGHAFDTVRVQEPVSYTHLTLPTNREV